MTKWLIAAVALALAVAPAQASDEPSLPTIFGLQLGAPVTLPECQRMKMPAYANPSGAPGSYLTVQPRTCQRLPTAIDPRGAIWFTPDQMPQLAQTNILEVRFEDGKLQSVDANTLGDAHAEGIVDLLTRKFGPPTRRSAERVVLDNVTIDGVFVFWQRPGYTVEYHSVADEIDSGDLLIETDRARAARLAREARRNAGGTPL